MKEPNESPHPAAFKDRRGGLTFFGILEILIGVVLFIVLLFFIFGMLMTKNAAGFENAQLETHVVLLNGLIYLILGVAFIWLGIGSMGYKRWARTLSLILSWFWFISGIAVLIFMIMFFPKTIPTETGDPGIPGIVFAIAVGFMSVLFVIIPGIFILFYRSEGVRLTVKKFDSKVRWTDNAPAPVIALSIMLVYFGLSPLFTASYGWMIPFFGIIIDGAPGFILHLLNTAVCIYLAISVMRLDNRTFWYVVAFFGFWFISATITFLTHSVSDIYARMLTEEQILLFSQQGFLTTPNLMLVVGLSFAAMAVYLWYVKRYFNQRRET